jgi:hypothetical protein
MIDKDYGIQMGSYIYIYIYIYILREDGEMMACSIALRKDIVGSSF